MSISWSSNLIWKKVWKNCNIHINYSFIFLKILSSHKLRVLWWIKKYPYWVQVTENHKVIFKEPSLSISWRLLFETCVRPSGNVTKVPEEVFLKLRGPSGNVQGLVPRNSSKRRFTNGSKDGWRYQNVYRTVRVSSWKDRCKNRNNWGVGGGQLDLMFEVHIMTHISHIMDITFLKTQKLKCFLQYFFVFLLQTSLQTMQLWVLWFNTSHLF